jgi:nucleotide-binding universal stress UspA family protein
MKIILAADGSKFTKKALAFLVANENLAGEADEIVVLHVQPAMPPRVKALVGAKAVSDYHAEESNKVLAPIDRFLTRHGLPHRCEWKVGPAAETILQVAKRERSHLIVMGTHGHGLLGRAVLGSVAQRVVAQCDVPVLLVK